MYLNIFSKFSEQVKILEIFINNIKLKFSKTIFRLNSLLCTLVECSESRPLRRKEEWHVVTASLSVFSLSAPPLLMACTSAQDGTPTLAAQARLHKYYPGSEFPSPAWSESALTTFL